MKSMNRPVDVPLLHLRGDDDPYVLNDPVIRTRRYAPDGYFAAIPTRGTSPTRSRRRRQPAHPAIPHRGVRAYPLTQVPVGTFAVLFAFANWRTPHGR